VAAPALDAGTVWSLWRRHAEERPHADAVVHWVGGEEPVRWSWGALWERALRYAAALREAGVRPGQVCATVVRHHPEFYPLYVGVELAGAIPSVLAYPNARLHPQKFRDGLEGMSRQSGIDWLLTEGALGEVVRPLVEKEGSTIRGLLFPFNWNLPAPDEDFGALAKSDPNAPCLLQHSSGTTGLQKGVALSHRAVREHVRRYGAAIGASDADRVVSWLPLYHDMGLIAAFHLPLALGIPVVQIDPFEWVIAPVLLVEAISREGGTLAWLPNFAYNLMADRIHDDELEGYRLDSVRLLVNCSEPVRAESHERFARRYAPYGLRPEALSACYAMAETTFAATQTPPGAPAPVLVAARQALADGRYVPAREGEAARACVSSGLPISGVEVRVLGGDGRDLGDGEVGELAIRSVSLFDGYRNNPAKTAEALRGGWYFSGDSGFRLDGHTYVIGRRKDLIIVAGKNLYPEDVEDAVGSVPGVLPGRVVAFGAEDAQAGTERVCVVAETAAEGEEARRALKLAVLEAGMRIDVTITAVYLVEPRWLIKSSSGKPSRSANRERALAELQPE
jgi:fatty-acyl-CoA synthase